MAVTTPDNIVTPDDGDDYALVQDLGAMADSVQEAITDWKNYGIGTDAERIALNGSSNPPLKEGLRWHSTDTGWDWTYTSSSWVVSHTPQTSFTPTWSGLTIGNGSTSGYYSVTGDAFTLYASVTLGSTSSFAGVVTITNIPVDMERAIGPGLYNDVGTGDFMLLGDRIGTNTIRVSSQVADGTFMRRSNLGDIGEASGDSFYVLVSGTVL